jgi:hypothetical protein
MLALKESMLSNENRIVSELALTATAFTTRCPSDDCTGGGHIGASRVGATVAVDTMGTMVGTTAIVAAVVAQVEEMEATMLTPTPLAILLRMDPGSASTLTPRGLPSGADHPEALVC